MNYFLYGADTYRSRKKLHEIVDAYREKWGGSADLHWIEVDEPGIAPLEEAAGTASLFSQKKTIVAERALASGVPSGQLIAFLKKHKGLRDVIVIVWEGDIGESQKKACAEVRAHTDKTQEFVPLALPRLTRWIREEAARRGAPLAAGDTALLAAHGSDLWAIANELEKVALGGGAWRATGATARASSAFDLGDAFFSSRGSAIGHLMSLAEHGEEEMPLFAYLANHARTLLVLKICAEERVSVPPALAIHPYVIKKTTRLIAGLRRDALMRILRRFFEEDAAIKTGDARPYESLLRMLL